MSMPQVTNVMSFGDAVKVLKNKGIITESHLEEEITTDKEKDNRYNSLVSTNRGEDKDFAKLSRDEKEKMMYADTDPNIADPINDSDAEFDAMLKQLEDEMAGEIAVKSDKLDEPLEEINEGKEPKAVDEDIEEVTTGIQIEHECHPDMEYDEIEKMVKKNIKKNPLYYTNYKLTGIRDYTAQTMDSSKPEDHQMKFYTEKTAVDTARGMKKVKMPKKDEKKKLKENVDEKMRFQDLPADPEVYKTVKDMKGKIMKATNAEGVEFQRGDVVKAYDGEEIKIADFKEEQGKIKALYNTGMFFKSIDIDGLEAPKQTMRPGVNIGASFEKMKRSMEEIIRETISEYFDGRDNLINPLSSKEENKQDNE
jgi:hypothetical protein